MKKGVVKKIKWENSVEVWAIECDSIDYIVANQTKEDVIFFLEENYGKEVEFKVAIDPYGQHHCFVLF